MNERNIQIILYNHYWNSWEMAVPNSNYYWTWECDVLAVMKSLYMVEFEIKTSVSDFKADFKNKADKHNILETQCRNKSPNRFYYVIPDDISDKCDVPKYAGKIVIKNQGWKASPVYEKKAPLLHKRKISENGLIRLGRSLHYRAWSYLKERNEN
jgi:hypothetical protein